MSIRMEVNAARIKKGVPRKGAPQRGETAASTPRNFARQRTAGFPLPLDNFFRQHERNCENLIFVNSCHSIIIWLSSSRFLFSLGMETLRMPFSYRARMSSRATSPT